MATGAAAIQLDSVGEASCRAALAMEKAHKIVHNGILLDFEEKARSKHHKVGPAAGDAERQKKS
jgi:hypothetical protein